MAIHPHQHSTKVIGIGGTVDQAITHALSGLLDPAGHFSRMAFHSFEVVKIGGTVESDGSRTLQVTLEAYASHKE